MIFDEDRLRRKGLSFQQVCWENWVSTCKRIKLDPYLTPIAKINSKWIKYIDTKRKTIKLLEENIGHNLHDIGFGNDFLHMRPKAQAAATTTKKNWTS